MRVLSQLKPTGCVRDAVRRFRAASGTGPTPFAPAEHSSAPPSLPAVESLSALDAGRARHGRSKVPGIVDEGIRLADVLAGLSLISDHGLGLPPDDAVRSCLVATALARKLDLHESEVADVFYDALLEHIGCMGYAHETAQVWGDDLAANRAAQRTNFADPKELFTAYLPTLLRDVEGRERVQVAAHFFTRGPGFLRRFATASCEVAAQTARRLRLPQEVQLSLRQYSEWWNGKGAPEGVKGEEIALTARAWCTSRAWARSSTS